MTAINPNDLAKFTWILEIRPAWTAWAFSRLASVKWLVANLDTSNIVEIKADDTGTIYKATSQITTINTDLYEIFSRDTLALLFNWTSTDVAATPVNILWEELWTGWTIWTPIKLANKNWDNLTVGSIVIDADGSALNVVTDYSSYVWDWINGDLWYTYIVPVTAQTWVLDADYTYTPNASEAYVTENDTQELKNFEIKITATSDWKDRTINCSSAALSSTYWLSFTDVMEAWDMTPAPLEFTSNKWSTTTYTNAIL